MLAGMAIRVANLIAEERAALAVESGSLLLRQLLLSAHVPDLLFAIDRSVAPWPHGWEYLPRS